MESRSLGSRIKDPLKDMGTNGEAKGERRLLAKGGRKTGNTGSENSLKGTNCPAGALEVGAGVEITGLLEWLGGGSSCGEGSGIVGIEGGVSKMAVGATGALSRLLDIDVEALLRKEESALMNKPRSSSTELKGTRINLLPSLLLSSNLIKTPFLLVASFRTSRLFRSVLEISKQFLLDSKCKDSKTHLMLS